MRVRARVGWTYIFLVRVEKPEGEVTGLGGGSELTQRLRVTCQQKPGDENRKKDSNIMIT